MALAFVPFIEYCELIPGTEKVEMSFTVYYAGTDVIASGYTDGYSIPLNTDFDLSATSNNQPGQRYIQRVTAAIVAEATANGWTIANAKLRFPEMQQGSA